ncbi:MAG: TonB-dependent receptor [Opitutaceae bacterium]
MINTLPSPPSSHWRSSALRRLIALCFSVATLFAAEAKRTFNVPAGPAEVALKLYSEQSGRGVIFSTDSLGAVKTNALRGEFTAREALNRLVAGTDLIVTADEKTGAFALTRPERPNAPRVAPLAPGDRPKPSDSSAPTDTLVLTPFEVNADKDNGYLSQNTASGSRLSAALRDTPAAITVFTSEFLQDIAATSVEELSKYAPNVEADVGYISALPNGNSLMNPTTGITVRGLPTSGGASSGRTVNFFSYIYEIDTYNTERIEFARGPNSILFGIGQAGGSFNIASRTADVRRPIVGATVRVGSYDALRGTIDLNQPIIRDKLAVRLDAVADHRLGWRPWEFSNNKRVYLALRYKPTPKTTLDFQSEGARSDFRRPRPYIGQDHITTWMAAGSPTQDAFASNTVDARGVRRIGTTPYLVAISNDSAPTVYNFANMGRTSNLLTDTTQIPMLQDFSVFPRRAVLQGPGTFNSTKFSNNTGLLRHEIRRDFFAELAVTKQVYHSDQADINGPDMTIYGDPSRLILNLPTGPRANPYVGLPYIEGIVRRRIQSDQRQDARFTTTYLADLGKIFGRHQLAGMAEHWEQKTRGATLIETKVDAPPTPGSPEDATNQIRRRTYLDFNGPVENVALADFRLTTLPGVAFTPSAAPSYNRYYLNTWMLATQSKFWRDRIVVTLGTRRDHLYSKLSQGVRGTERVGGFTTGFLRTGNGPTNKVDGKTLSQGAVLHVTNWFSVFGNHSTNFALPALNQFTLPRSPVPSPNGKTYDLGGQLGLLGGRVVARLTYYQTSVVNNSANVGTGNIQDRLNNIWNTLATTGVITAARRDQELVTANAYNYDNDSQGWEGEVVANVTPNWRLLANLSTNKTSWTNVAESVRAYMDEHRPLFQQSTSALVQSELATVDNYITNRYANVEGTQLQLSPKWSGNVRTNYTFAGKEDWLKGFSLGAGVRWRKGTLLGNTSTNPATRAPIYSGSNTIADANVGYRRRVEWLGRKTTVSVQLNVNNLFDNQRILPQTANAAGQTYNYRFQTPREWIVTTTFAF